MPNRGVVIANRRRDIPILVLMVNILRWWAGLVSMDALERKRTMNKVVNDVVRSQYKYVGETDSWETDYLISAYQAGHLLRRMKFSFIVL